MPRALGAPDVSVEEAEMAMQAWFPPGPLAQRQPFDEMALRSVANALRSIGREQWATIPRIYVTLRIINQLPAIESFLAQGLSDLWFPFTHKMLPDCLKSQTARNDFIEAQRLVLTKNLNLENKDGKHRHYSKPQDIPLLKLSELGRGGFSVVEKVLCTVSQRREYARKLLLRGPTFQKNKEVLRQFEEELTTLKKLSHIHIVEVMGSYTDPKYVAIIMSPVADCNLREFLEYPLTSDRSSLLRTSFGCLVAAVNYLHENRIRHKDIKPQNILIKEHQVYVTDFGISRDWTDLGHSTTTGPIISTPRYCAPEVAASQPRNSSADIWSLGCVFVEMWTVLCGESVQNLLKHLWTPGNQSACYHDKLDRVDSWQEVLVNNVKRTGDTELQKPREWISAMMRPAPHDRLTAQSLLNDIHDSCLDSSSKYAFIGFCCIEHNESEESVQSSDPETTPSENLVETSNALSKALPDRTVLRVTTNSSEESMETPTVLRKLDPSTDISLTSAQWTAPSKNPYHAYAHRRYAYDADAEPRSESTLSDSSIQYHQKAKQKSIIPMDITLVQTLQGHVGEVHHVAFSPDGKWLASAGSDETVRLWSVGVGKC